MSRIGFFGVGLMGHGMAGSLMRGGHQLTVIADRNRQPVDDLVARGAREAKSRTELAAGQDAIFLCVNGTPQVEAVLAEIEPVLSAGQYVVDISTSLPDSSLAIAERLAKRGIRFVDAPIGGGRSKRRRPTGLDGRRQRRRLRRGRAVAECTSRVVSRMGEVGAGARAKLINNFISIGQSALVIEAYRMAREQGIDWQSLFDINMGGAARSGSLERMLPPAIAGNFMGYCSRYRIRRRTSTITSRRSPAVAPTAPSPRRRETISQTQPRRSGRTPCKVNCCGRSEQTRQLRVFCLTLPRPRVSNAAGWRRFSRTALSSVMDDTARTGPPTGANPTPGGAHN